jgi:hypothetical protein
MQAPTKPWIAGSVPASSMAVRGGSEAMMPRVVTRSRGNTAGVRRTSIEEQRIRQGRADTDHPGDGEPKGAPIVCRRAHAIAQRLIRNFGMCTFRPLAVLVRSTLVPATPRAGEGRLDGSHVPARRRIPGRRGDVRLDPLTPSLASSRLACRGEASVALIGEGHVIDWWPGARVVSAICRSPRAQDVVAASRRPCELRVAPAAQRGGTTADHRGLIRATAGRGWGSGRSRRDRGLNMSSGPTGW